MSKEVWHKGYQEVKNVIHNDMGVTKEELLEVFRQIAKDEIQKIVGENKKFIWQTIQKVIKSEMIYAVNEHKYPRVNGHVWDWGGGDGIDKFKDYVTGVMKEEIMQRMEEQFEVSVNIEKKD